MIWDREARGSPLRMPRNEASLAGSRDHPDHPDDLLMTGPGSRAERSRRDRVKRGCRFRTKPIHDRDSCNPVDRGDCGRGWPRLDRFPIDGVRWTYDGTREGALFASASPPRWCGRGGAARLPPIPICGLPSHRGVARPREGENGLSTRWPRAPRRWPSSQRPPGDLVDAVLQELDAAVGEQGVDPAGVPAPHRHRPIGERSAIGVRRVRGQQDRADRPLSQTGTRPSTAPILVLAGDVLSGPGCTSGYSCSGWPSKSASPCPCPNRWRCSARACSCRTRRRCGWRRYCRRSTPRRRRPCCSCRP